MSGFCFRAAHDIEKALSKPEDGNETAMSERDGRDWEAWMDISW